VTSTCDSSCRWRDKHKIRPECPELLNNFSMWYTFLPGWEDMGKDTLQTSPAGCQPINTPLLASPPVRTCSQESLALSQWSCRPWMHFSVLSFTGGVWRDGGQEGGGGDETLMIPVGKRYLTSQQEIIKLSAVLLLETFVREPQLLVHGWGQNNLTKVNKYGKYEC